MVGSAAGNATPTPGRWAFIAFAFDAGAVASFAFGALMGGAWEPPGRGSAGAGLVLRCADSPDADEGGLGIGGARFPRARFHRYLP